MPSARLTNKLIESHPLPEGSRTVELWDTEQKGLLSKLTPDSKTGEMRKPLTEEIRQLLDAAKAERVIGSRFVRTAILDRPLKKPRSPCRGFCRLGSCSLTAPWPSRYRSLWLIMPD